MKRREYEIGPDDDMSIPRAHAAPRATRQLASSIYLHAAVRSVVQRTLDRAAGFK
jgi:hypothetical protein